MRKILILLLALSIVVSAKPVSSSGKVIAYYRHGNIWKGTPSRVCISVINDFEYAYYIVADTTSSLMNYVGKEIKFSGNIYKDSTTLKDGGLPHWFIKGVDFELKK